MLGMIGALISLISLIIGLVSVLFLWLVRMLVVVGAVRRGRLCCGCGGSCSGCCCWWSWGNLGIAVGVPDTTKGPCGGRQLSPSDFLLVVAVPPPPPPLLLPLVLLSFSQAVQSPRF